MLKDYIGDCESILLIEGQGIQEKLSYEEVLVEISDRQVMKLSNKEVASVKVLCKNFLIEIKHRRLRPT